MVVHDASATHARVMSWEVNHQVMGGQPQVSKPTTDVVEMERLWTEVHRSKAEVHGSRAQIITLYFRH